MFTQWLSVQVESNDSTPAMQVRVTLHVVDAIGNVIATRHHRTSIPYENSDVWMQMGMVTEDITAMGWPSLTADQIAMIKAHHDLEKSRR